MREYLSPRDLAAATGISESSLKRWADDGVIAVTRTAGGHRRIARAEALRFIRERNARVLRPEVLGFPAAALHADTPEDALFDALRRGDQEPALGLVQGWFLAGRPLAWIFDGPVAGAMGRIGRLWKHGRDGILREHQATELCIQAVTQLRLALPPAGDDAPVAVGAAPRGDPYLLPGLLAAAVAEEAGLRAVNLGPETPLAVLQAAAKERHATLVWLSVSTEQGAASARAGLPAVLKALTAAGTHVIVGGRYSHQLAACRSPHLTFATRMAELAAFAKGLQTARRP